jgi:hypothetical protein
MLTLRSLLKERDELRRQLVIAENLIDVNLSLRLYWKERAEAAEKKLGGFKALLKTELDQLAGQIEENIHELRVWVEEGKDVE